MTSLELWKIRRVERLMAEAVKEGECLICLLTPSKEYAWVHGFSTAHRLVWEVTKGPIPVGMMVCHTCDTPRCVNILHLFLGTAQDNMDDKVAKGRWKNGAYKLLGPEQIEVARQLREQGWTYERIGNRFLVSRRTVKRALSFPTGNEDTVRVGCDEPLLF